MRIGQSPYNTQQIKSAAETQETQEALDTVPQDGISESAETAGKESAALQTRTGGKSAVNIETLLRAFEVPDTPQNRLLIRNMLSGGISATKENFAALSQILERFEDLTVRQAVFMAREEIPINQQNIRQFQGFLQHSNLVGNQLENILNIIGEEQLPEQISQNPQISETPDTAPQPKANENHAPPGQPAAGDAPRQPAQADASFVNTPSPETAEQETQTSQTAQIPQTQQTAEVSAKAAAANPLENSPPLQPQEIPRQVPPEQPENFTPVKFIKPNQPEQIINKPYDYRHAVSESAAEPHVTQKTQGAESKPELQTTLGHDAIQSAAPEKTVANMPEQIHSGRTAVEPDTEKIPQAQKTATPKETVLPDEPVQSQEAVQSQETDKPERLDKLIASLFKKVDPEHARRLPREMNAQTLVRELHEAAEAIKQRLPEMSGEKRAVLGKAVAELEQNVEFLNKLSDYTPVINVPLQWGKERTTAELYVFNDSKGKRKIDPQNATVFVSLMTANAGRVETMIKVLGKNVECDFSLEMPETVDLVTGEMQNLSKLLDSQGYRLARTSAMPAEKARDIFDVKDVRDAQKSKYFFDRTV